MLIANDDYQRAITEYGRQKLGSMSISLAVQYRLVGFKATNSLKNKLSCVHKVIVEPTIFTFQDFPICLCELIQLILEQWRRSLRGWLIRLTHFRFPEDSILYTIRLDRIPGMFPRCQDEPRGPPFFLSPIQFDSWLASPLDFPKVQTFVYLQWFFRCRAFQEVFTYQYISSEVRLDLFLQLYEPTYDTSI